MLLYTDYIWSSYSKIKEKINIYSILKKENSNHKITVSGFVNTKLDIKLATYLKNLEDRCKEKSHYNYISVRSETPLIKG
ncbi:hypothetical protein CRV01_10090 [Arcobacter sp. CECT 8983]|uniref:hypothetical protein n=1 Tax=Arcobacter sp. CECT 8983 TaxID=2044508 RepID=UPI00100B6474|nr:hypothetical protein [Arcobacter sp. CECT 8983]RXJ88962.1 hypothetical protein CRV01_10090 [Arcobacter sp. CECT 8983]